MNSKSCIAFVMHMNFYCSPLLLIAAYSAISWEQLAWPLVLIANRFRIDPAEAPTTNIFLRNSAKNPTFLSKIRSPEQTQNSVER